MEQLGVGPGQQVLDVGAGHANCAIAAARLGARVTASDFSPTVIAAGRARTKRAELDVHWDEADLAALPYADVDVSQHTVTFRYPSWSPWREATDEHGTSVLLREATPPEAYAALLQRSQEMTAEHNRDENGAMAIDHEYVVITARKV